MKPIPYLRKLIALNRIASVFELLEANAGLLGPGREKHLILLSSQYRKLVEDEGKGLLSKSDAKLHYSQVNNGLLELIEQLPETAALAVPPGEERKLNFQYFLYRRGGSISLLLGILLLSAIIFLYHTPKKNIRVKIELVTNKFDFKLKEDYRIFSDQTPEGIELLQFKEVKLPVPGLLLQDDFEDISDTFAIDSQQGGYFKLTAISAYEGNNLLLKQKASLQEIRFNQDAFVFLSIPEELSESENTIKIDVSPGNASGILTFQDTVLFEFNNIIFSQHSQSSFREETIFREGVVFQPPGAVANVEFTGMPDLFSIIIEPDENGNWSIQGEQLSVDTINFERLEPVNRKLKSGILEGTVYFLKKNDQPYDSFSIGKGSFLKTGNIDYMQVSNLMISNQKIEVTLIGGMEKIYRKSSEGEELKLMNPSLLRWLLSNYPLWSLLVVLSWIFMIAMVWNSSARKLFVKPVL